MMMTGWRGFRRIRGHCGLEYTGQKRKIGLDYAENMAGSMHVHTQCYQHGSCCYIVTFPGRTNGRSVFLGLNYATFRHVFTIPPLHLWWLHMSISFQNVPRLFQPLSSPVFIFCPLCFNPRSTCSRTFATVHNPQPLLLYQQGLKL